MRLLRISSFTALLTIGFSLTSGALEPAAPLPSTKGKNEPSKEVVHGQMLEKRYAVSAFKILAEMKVSQQLYQEAVNDAYASGVPSRLLSEFVALRAMRNADAKT